MNCPSEGNHPHANCHACRRPGPAQPADPERRCRRLRRPVRTRCGDRVVLRGTAGDADAPGRPGSDPRVLAACHGVAAATGGLRGGEASPDPGSGGGDHGDAGDGDRHRDGPVVHHDVRPDHPDPGRPYRALPRLRRSPDPGRRHRGSASGKLTWVLDAGSCVLAGHSWGGMLVQLLAFRRPDLVAGLVLVDPGHEELESALPLPAQWGWRIINAVFPDELRDDAPVTLAAMRELRAAARPFPDVPVVVMSAARGFPRRFRASWTRPQAGLAA